MAKKKTGSGQFPLRLPNDLRLRIEKAAKGRNIALNAEILQRLEQSFHIENRFGGPRATALVEAMGQAMMAGGECAGSFKFGKLGHYREWLDFKIPYTRAASMVLTILKHNRPVVDGAVPSRTAAEGIKQTAAEVVARHAAEMEHLATRAAAEVPTPSTAGRYPSVEVAASWERAIGKSEVLHGLASTPQELHEKIQRVYADLGALLAALGTRESEEGI